MQVLNRDFLILLDILQRDNEHDMVIIIWVDLYGIGNARVVDPRSKLEDIKTIRF